LQGYYVRLKAWGNGQFSGETSSVSFQKIEKILAFLALGLSSRPNDVIVA